ncbi:MAG: glycosyltransferase family 4 protein [Patescibacteria group bacterium]|nr:glycosyltransferase family 4 protein [Patescibacteria group bacterium]
MRVHFFTKGDETAGSSRLRAFFVADYLKRLGMDTVVHNPSTMLASTTRWPKKFTLLVQYARILRSIKKGDVIFLQRTIYNKYFLVLIVLYRLTFRRKMVFDFDDAVYLHSPFRTKLLCRLSDAVIVAYYTSQEWARAYNANVHMIPTSIPFETYAKERKELRAAPDEWLIGWVGNGVDQLVNLKLLAPAFAKLLKQGRRFKFRIIGALGYRPLYDFFTELLGDRAEFIDALDWTKPEAVIQEIRKFDISVVPLVLDEWNRGKYSLKALETMSLGIPTVIMGTEGARQVIQDGQNGFLATEPEEWASALSRIMDMDAAAYAAMGDKARATVKEGYSLESNVPKIRDIIVNL